MFLAYRCDPIAAGGSPPATKLASLIPAVTAQSTFVSWMMS